MAFVIESRTKIIPKTNNGETAAKKFCAGTSLVDSSWEFVDPNPDIRSLFLQFNDEYFYGRLAGCEVRWSPRMTLCAGQCHYEGRGGLCSIRLSQPLLKFRPRKDLVETLLHEMIHAYLFVTDNNKDHDGHGPEFQSHMNRINSLAETKISVYHNFHAEVAENRQHWWRCEGPCRERKPFFGWVKRASNRAPGPNDLWHDEHKRSCGGNFVKVKEPEGYQAKKKSKKGQPFSGEGHSLHEETKPLQDVTKNKPAKAKSKKIISPVKTSKTLDDYFSKLSGTGQNLNSKETIHEPSSSTSSSKFVDCPICGSKINENLINDHLDLCVSS